MELMSALSRDKKSAGFYNMRTGARRGGECVSETAECSVYFLQ